MQGLTPPCASAYANTPTLQLGHIQTKANQRPQHSIRVHMYAQTKNKRVCIQLNSPNGDAIYRR